MILRSGGGDPYCGPIDCHFGNSKTPSNKNRPPAAKRPPRRLHPPPAENSYPPRHPAPNTTQVRRQEIAEPAGQPGNGESGKTLTPIQCK